MPHKASFGSRIKVQFACRLLGIHTPTRQTVLPAGEAGRMSGPYLEGHCKACGGLIRRHVLASGARRWKAVQSLQPERPHSST